MVKIFGFQILKSAYVDRAKTQLQKANSLLYGTSDLSAQRPEMDVSKSYGTDALKVPYLPVPYAYLYEIAYYSDVLRTVHISLKNEAFRNGLLAVSRFEKKCPVCSKEFETEKKICDEHGEEEIETREPDSRQKFLLERWMKDVNQNDQTLEEVSREREDDFNIVDDAYFLILNEYDFDGDGNIMGMSTKEVIRGDPRQMAIIADKTGRLGRKDNGTEIFFCVQHRDKILESEDCPKCKCTPLRAYYSARGYMGEGTGELYYGKHEVIHRSKFHPSLTYGFSPILPIWQKVVTLWYQDKYVKDLYLKQRPPRGLLFINSANWNSFKKAWKWMQDKVRRNPHGIYPLALESPSKRGNIAQWIDLMSTLPELQFTEHRNELRRQIGAIYGVMPLFQGDLSSTSGLNNEGLQITVTNRAMENTQKVHNKDYDNLLERVTIYDEKTEEEVKITDWKIEVAPSEERDEMAELQREAQKIANASAMRSIGFKVVTDEEGEFVFSSKPEERASELTEPKSPLLEEPAGRQRFSGEPESVRRSSEIKKSDKFYLKQFKEHGDSAEGVGWINKESQEKRFEIMANIIKGGNPDVLDLGCGTGNFYQYLVKIGKKPKYKGIDRIHDYVKIAKKKGLDAATGEIIGFKEPHDYIVCSGAFNLEGDVKKAIKNMWENTRKSMAINMLSKKPSKEYTDYDPARMLQFAKTLNPEAELVTGYLPNDFTIVMKRTPTIPEKFLRAQTGKFTSQLTKLLLPIISQIDFKRKDKKQIKNATQKVLDLLRGRLENRGSQRVRSIYMNTFEGVEKELDLNLILFDEDKKQIEKIRSSKTFLEGYENLTQDASKKIDKIITDAFKKPKEIKIADMVKDMRKEIRAKESALERIARTETQNIVNLARKSAYQQVDKKGKFKYAWIGPSDSRVTEYCKRIKERTKSGVSLNNLREVIKEEADKKIFMDSRPFTPHINCRHILRRI